MEKVMRVESVSIETIKPSSPTPQNLKTYKLSFIDQLILVKYTPILLFYPNTDHEEGLLHLTADDKLVRLKTSLSQTLTYYYPMAGRLRGNAIIECNDEGAEFYMAHVHGVLSDILKQPDADSVHQFMPINDGTNDGPLVKVQANVFECGGLVIGVCMSHKIADACTLSSFIRVWSSMAMECMTEDMAPKYVLGSLYPFMDPPIVQRPPLQVKIEQSNCITRRYVFDFSNIQKLKAKAKSNIVDQPTRVEVVLSLIWKCATIASRKNLRITKSSSMVSQVVNIRKRVSPPLPETSVGNFLSLFKVHAKEYDNIYYMELQDLVVQLRKGLEEFCNVHVKEIQGENAFDAIYERWKDLELMNKKDVGSYYFCTSWCHYGFYDADYGWGKPKWVSPPSNSKDNFILMDKSDGKGIEAWVTLSEEDITVLETNTELLEFASPNPSVI